jgi:alpha-glucosidase
VAADDDQLVFLRELPDERLLVRLARAPGPAITLPTALVAFPDEAEHLLGGDPVKAGSEGVTLPDDGPAVDVWRL